MSLHQNESFFVVAISHCCSSYPIIFLPKVGPRYLTPCTGFSPKVPLASVAYYVEAPCRHLQKEGKKEEHNACQKNKTNCVQDPATASLAIVNNTTKQTHPCIRVERVKARLAALTPENQVQGQQTPEL